MLCGICITSIPSKTYWFILSKINLIKAHFLLTYSGEERCAHCAASVEILNQILMMQSFVFLPVRSCAFGVRRCWNLIVVMGSTGPGKIASQQSSIRLHVDRLRLIFYNLIYNASCAAHVHSSSSKCSSIDREGVSDLLYENHRLSSGISVSTLIPWCNCQLRSRTSYYRPGAFLLPACNESELYNVTGQCIRLTQHLPSSSLTVFLAAGSENHINNSSY